MIHLLHTFIATLFKKLVVFGAQYILLAVDSGIVVESFDAMDGELLDPREKIKAEEKKCLLAVNKLKPKLIKLKPMQSLTLRLNC